MFHTKPGTQTTNQPTNPPNSSAQCNRIYRVIQEESAIIWEMIVCVILSKKVHMNMCPILDGYGVMTA